MKKRSAKGYPIEMPPKRPPFFKVGKDMKDRLNMVRRSSRNIVIIGTSTGIGRVTALRLLLTSATDALLFRLSGF